MRTSLERAISRFRRRPVMPADGGSRPASAAAFRTAVELRLSGLERETAELKGRVNGLIFLVIGTVITQVTLKLVQ